MSSSKFNYMDEGYLSDEESSNSSDGYEGETEDSSDGYEVVEECPEDSPEENSNSQNMVKGESISKLDIHLFKDNNKSEGGRVKREKSLIRTHSKKVGRAPNMNCRIETYGRICEKFDDRRRRWVKQMSFEGMLNLVNKYLPKQFCYWLMTRVDPISEKFIGPDGIEFSFCSNQVHWVLGIPNKGDEVPRSAVNEEMKHKVSALKEMYGKPCSSKGNSVGSIGIVVTSSMMDRLEGNWAEEEEEEFKTLFLLISLDLVLCPTQFQSFPVDLILDLTLSMRAKKFDWASLVLEKLYRSVKSFARRLYGVGYAGGVVDVRILLRFFIWISLQESW